ncbi:nicotinate-nucleotide--dimethylbenzimidazole phosphoribosyltransferase [Gluconobacter wancherniae]|uniref:Nicotinate-nucleotide--dimethylbenzimidazole phosphoribosyltransferase n=1 Tax=Gluconobacter wancherniae NBRC 103581 TaxID=656744 RepID=A0A511AXQ4_9PROT|nr:nicotinate-nucleotide-dimethylbenzimidazole phosphoribosyltransferase [Gluconobacter wancherniae NBRC 103581]GEK92964.1 nicotinate-nucleotide--dimethylbenzimidazole phosphoribosyltransferase [Gluconobacter wancherniae NBRC 103581]
MTAPDFPRAPFQTMHALREACINLRGPARAAGQQIADREATLTKPAGSLGRLEELTRWMGEWQNRVMPSLERIQVIVFAGNHGVVAQGVSPWPSDVTAQMVANFEHGGAAINQLARIGGARLDVICLEKLRSTRDFTQGAAMDEAGFLSAVNTGYVSVSPDTDLLCPGEMGIGNTTAASTLSAALFGGQGSDWAGRGTGLDDAGVTRKAHVIDRALSFHGESLRDPLEAARRVGGFELAAIMGAVLAARHHGIPVLLDGFVCTAAAAPLFALSLDGLDHTRLSHRSAEAAHMRLAGLLGLDPLLNMALRLGEASGGALAIPLLKAALACHEGMATFADAAISQADSDAT